MPGLPKKTTRPDLPTTFWIWKRSPGEEYKIRYHQSGEKGPALVLIHGVLVVEIEGRRRVGAGQKRNDRRTGRQRRCYFGIKMYTTCTTFYESSFIHSYTTVSLTGFGGNANHWAQNVPDLNPHYRVYALDLLGKHEG